MNPSANMELTAGTRVYFIGIGGTSMAGLAEITQAHGCVVSGSDIQEGHRIRRLRDHGVTLYIGHDAAHIDAFRPDLVVHTAAISPDNPELTRAKQQDIATVGRADFLGRINREYRRVINISGTHGKTTTTAMCASLLIRSGQDPTVHLGADVREFDSTVRMGSPGGLMVSEACEYQRAFLSFHSTTATILNMDFDHVDCYRSIDDVIDAFVAFALNVPDDGRLVLPASDPHRDAFVTRLDAALSHRGRSGPKRIWFGFASDPVDGREPDVCCEMPVSEEGLPEFTIRVGGHPFTSVRLQVYGQHNVLNALAAVASALDDGATPDGVRDALSRFTGAEGRFDYRGRWHGAAVVSDYAHHPAAARATLAAAATFPHRHLWVVFQPLTFSRTRVLFDDFVSALLPAPFTVFAEIYSDRDRDGRVSSRNIADEINRQGGHAGFAEDFAAIRRELLPRVEDGDLILVLGPEDIRSFADWLLETD